MWIGSKRFDIFTLFLLLRKTIDGEMSKCRSLSSTISLMSENLNTSRVNIGSFFYDDENMIIFYDGDDDKKNMIFLASQDALEVMLFTHSLTLSVMVSIDLTDVTLVSDDT